MAGFFVVMFFVYALYSEAHNKIYVGCTSDVAGRLAAHNHPSNKGYTAKYQPWKMVYSESVSTKAEALKREKELKSAMGRKFIWGLILTG